MAPPPSELMMPPVPGTDPGASGGLPRAHGARSPPSSAFSCSSSSADSDGTSPILGHHSRAGGPGYQTMGPGDRQGGGPEDRACRPGTRGGWSLSWEAYGLKTAGGAVLLPRRVCMHVVLGTRTATSVVAVVGDAARDRVLGAVLGAVLGVVGFLSVAWCLAVIGQAEGRRKVLGVMVTRLHFDLFLLVAAFVHAALLVGSFAGLGTSGGQAAWLVMWLPIFLVAWIGTWPAEQESHA
ncbi:hypothetical protein LX36DRAFT_747516 [Colletotrichum falcatum]|nr:hypothetical protein LX36DRAFT_747516 [Colletotrichum falcatum]